MHSSNSHVRIYDYILHDPEHADRPENANDFSIVSAIHFGLNAESHKGLCHGVSFRFL
jgi:hypothetical protein